MAPPDDTHVTFLEQPMGWRPHQRVELSCHEVLALYDWLPSSPSVAQASLSKCEVFIGMLSFSTNRASTFDRDRKREREKDAGIFAVAQPQRVRTARES